MTRTASANIRWALLTAATLATLTTFGCSQGNQEVKDNARQTKEDAKRLGRDLEAGAQQAGSAIKGAVQEAGQEAGAAKRTLDVKAALIADSTVDASNVNVDTDDNTRTILLRGTVPTVEQRTAAERIAREKADGYSVNNQLTIAPAK